MVLCGLTLYHLNRAATSTDIDCAESNKTDDEAIPELDILKTIAFISYPSRELLKTISMAP
jgi:hypothetical protein